jgi:hypothetical protein
MIHRRAGLLDGAFEVDGGFGGCRGTTDIT